MCSEIEMQEDETKDELMNSFLTDYRIISRFKVSPTVDEDVLREDAPLIAKTPSRLYHHMLSN